MVSDGEMLTFSKNRMDLVALVMADKVGIRLRASTLPVSRVGMVASAVSLIVCLAEHLKVADRVRWNTGQR